MAIIVLTSAGGSPAVGASGAFGINAQADRCA